MPLPTVPENWLHRLRKRAGLAWEWLVTPHASLSGTDRQQARLLLSFVVATFPSTLILALLDIFFPRGGYLAGYVFFDISFPLVILLAYRIGRTKRFLIGAWIVVAAPTVVIILLVFVLNPDDVGVFVLYYLVFCPVLASLLLNVQATILMAALNLLVIFVGVNNIRHWDLERMTDEILFNILIPTLLVVSAVIRQQYIKQLKQAEHVARLAKEEAERSNNVKSTFLAAMSHELRTPLNAILNFTKLFLLKMYGEVTDEQKEALNTVYDSGTHLLNLINDILDIAKIEADGMQLLIENDVNLVEEMKPVILSARALMKDKPVQFITDFDERLPPIACDRRRIKQVIFNLISNAAKFTEQGSITFSIKKKPRHIVLMVSDTGPGISIKEQSVIFQPFRQTQTGIKHGSGTGLGLSISKSIVDAHGGSLWVESDDGEGATFFIVLPLYTKDASASPGIDADHDQRAAQPVASE